MKLPVNPELFDILLKYVRQVERGKVDIESPLQEASPLLTFCENFFAQFFQNELKGKITSVDSAAKKQAVKIRRKLKERGGDKEVLLLVTWFEQLCDIYPDIQNLLYVSEPAGFSLEFHHGYIPTLLKRIEDWARKRNYAQIEKRCRACLEKWKSVLGEQE